MFYAASKLIVIVAFVAWVGITVAKCLNDDDWPHGGAATA